MKKYEFTGEVKMWLGHTLHRIRATASFGDVKEGEVGGWIEKEENLSHDGDAWVYGDAQVCGNAWVYGNARVYGNAWVCGNACYLNVGPLGSRGDFTTFFRTKDLDIHVSCGCFRGSIQEFSEKVRETHGDNIYAKQYMAAIEFAKTCIDLTPEKVGDAECQKI